QPVLEQNCFECHAADAKKVRGGLLLDTPSGIRKGGDSGPIVVAGDAGHSLLIQAIQHEGELHMPPNKPKLSGAILADFVKWVELGAPDPRQSVAASASDDLGKARAFWSFRAVQKVRTPTVKDSHWPQTSVDCFVLAQLEANGLHPAP